MQVIPQEFESLLNTSKRYKFGRNCPPPEIWKLVVSIDKLKSRPYLEGQKDVQSLLSQASKNYQNGLSAVSDRVKFRLSDTTKFFSDAAEDVQKAYNLYCAQKDIVPTNTNTISVTPDVLTTATEVHKFLDPYYGDISNNVKRLVRFVEKTDGMPVIYKPALATGSVRPAQFGNGWETWITTNDNPETIWIIARTGNAFTTANDIKNFIHQYFPNATYYNNTIAFAREISNIIDQKKSASPSDTPIPVNAPLAANGVMTGDVATVVGSDVPSNSPVVLSPNGKSYIVKKN